MLRSALEFRVVHRYRGSTYKNILCVRGYTQHVRYEYLVFASTPSLGSLKLMLTVSLAYIWSIHTYGIATVVLHGTLHDALYAWVPSEFYPDGISLG